MLLFIGLVIGMIAKADRLQYTEDELLSHAFVGFQGYVHTTVHTTADTHKKHLVVTNKTNTPCFVIVCFKNK